MRISSAFTALLLIGAVALFVFFVGDDFLRLIRSSGGPDIPPEEVGLRSERIPDDWYRCAKEYEWSAPNEIDAMMAAAEAGDTLAQYATGISYMTNFGNPCLPDEGAKWLIRAAEQGMPQAEYAAGLVYLWGYGVTADRVEAIEWFEAAAEDLHAGALNALGVLELETEAGRLEAGKVDLEDCIIGECLVWVRATLEEAASYGSLWAIVNLGFAYGLIGDQLDEEGHVAAALENYEEAYFWYALAGFYLNDADVWTRRDFLADKIAPSVRSVLDERAAEWRPDTPLPEANDPVDTDPGQFL